MPRARSWPCASRQLGVRRCSRVANLIILELESGAELMAVYPLLAADFGDDLTLTEFQIRAEAMAREGGHWFSLWVDDQPVCAACGAVLTDLSNGRHLQIYELATDPAHRSRGYGRSLIDDIEAWAAHQACERVVLYSGPQRLGAQRFWETHMGYQRRGVVFKKML